MWPDKLTLLTWVLMCENTLLSRADVARHTWSTRESDARHERAKECRRRANSARLTREHARDNVRAVRLCANNVRRRVDTRDIARGQRAAIRMIRTHDTRRQRVVTRAKQHARHAGITNQHRLYNKQVLIKNIWVGIIILTCICKAELKL
jgi:hypothetical protein